MATSLSAIGPRPGYSRAIFCFPLVRTHKAAAIVRTRGHYDVPMRGCTVELDGKTIIAAGRLVDPAMIVPRQAR